MARLSPGQRKTFVIRRLLLAKFGLGGGGVGGAQAKAFCLAEAQATEEIPAETQVATSMPTPAQATAAAGSLVAVGHWEKLDSVRQIAVL